MDQPPGVRMQEPRESPPAPQGAVTEAPGELVLRAFREESDSTLPPEVRS